MKSTLLQAAVTAVAKTLLLLSFMLIIAGCGSVTREIEQTSADTASIEVSVKQALISDVNIDAAAIAVSYTEGTIVLRGFVGSEDEKQQAEDLAKSNANEIPVVNNLRVQR